ncbi:MAG TPA: hypothetical protein VMI54_11665 [Polyangiaceae bacterium]|nr:hypothetical protein [Polyangiaceae bacterium]
MSLGVAVGACGAGKHGAGAADASQPPSADANGPKVLSGADFDREAAPVGKQVVNGGDVWSAYIEANAPPKVEKSDAGFAVTADLGWASPVQCFVYEHVIDAGAAVHQMLKAAAKDVKFKVLVPYFVEHQAFDPMLAIRGVYNVEKDGKLLAGDFKLMVVPRPEHPLMCWHDAPGYAKSFARVASEFAKSFQFKSQRPAPARGELWIATLDGMPVGFSRDMTYVVAGDKVSRVSLGARFLPTGPGEMSFEDEAEVIGADGEGSIATGKYINEENGEATLTIDIERTKSGYNYVGTIQGKSVSGSFKTKQPLKAHYAVEKKLRALGAPKKAKFDELEYDPSLDVKAGSKVTYDVNPEGDGLVISSSIGQRGMIMRANGRGVVKRLEFLAGAKKVEVDLVEETGEL